MITDAGTATVTGFLLARIAEDEATVNTALADPTRWDAGDWVDRAWSPTRILAECEAKRWIVTEHGSGADPCDAHGADYRTVPCDTLLHLAAVYADHPDYSPEWRDG